MSSSFIRWGVPAAMVVLLVAALWMANGVAAQMGGWVPHMASHLTAAVVGAALTVIAVVLSSRLQVSRFLRGAGGRVGPLVFVAGLAWFTASQLVESLSAVAEYPNAGFLHTASGMASMLGLLAAVTGLVLAAFAGMRDKNVSLRAPLAVSIAGAAILLIIMMAGFSPLAVVVAVIFCALLVGWVLLGRRRGRL